MTPTHSQKAFSLVEILVSVAILALLAALALPAYKNAIRSAQTAQCASNLRQLFIASVAYSTEKNAPLYTADETATFWARSLQIYLDAPNAPPTQRPLGAFACPSSTFLAPGWCGTCDYGKNQYVNGNSTDSSPKFIQTNAMPGAEKIFFVADSNNTWGLSPYSNKGAAGMQARHNGTANVLFYDGHIEAIYVTLPKMYPSLLTGGAPPWVPN